jgi:hypothetical protein
MSPRTHLRRLAALAVAGGALFVAPAGAQAAMVVTAKSFSTQEAAPLSRTILATFSDDAAGAPGAFTCSASTYTGTIDWGDGTAPEPVSIADRFGGDFPVCEYTVNSDHKYAHFGVFTTTISISGGPLAHTGADSGEITVADVNIVGESKTVNATAGQAFVGEVAEFKDQNPLSQPGDFTSTIDWGDGSLISAGVITGKDGSFSVSGSHVYATTGSFPVRVTLAHPTATPAVALGSASVAPAPPQQQNNNQPTLFTPTFSVRGKAKSSGITLKALRSPGLAVQIGASAARTETIVVLRGTSRLGSAKVKVKRGLNRVRFKPSSKLAKKLRSGRQYGLRIKVAGEPTLQLTFRIRAPKR